MIDRIEIRNFKSITQLEMDLGQVNVLIGANGSGKSNILEAIGMLASRSGDKIELDSMAQRGIRIARPELMTNSFYGKNASKMITITIENHACTETYRLSQLNEEGIYSPWKIILPRLSQENDPKMEMMAFVSRYAIYSPNIDVLRGLTSASTLYPLGIHGEGLDVLLSQLPKEDIAEIENIAQHYITWIGDLVYDSHDLLKYRGYKLGRSNSNLYFTDKFMQRRNNFFSAENANEGALVLLFYLALLVSKSTPRFFAIDNIDSGLNPRLCRYLMKEIGRLAKEHGKQLIVTTHNPAILDGLNLNNGEEKLFSVERSDEGNTMVTEIKTKPNIGRRVKLSELWMNGLIGGMPEDF